MEQVADANIIPADAFEGFVVGPWAAVVLVGD